MLSKITVTFAICALILQLPDFPRQAAEMFPTLVHLMGFRRTVDRDMVLVPAP